MNEIQYCETIALWLKKIRTERGFTQEEVANIELDVKTYRRIENGENVPNLKTLIRILVNLNISLADFFDMVESEIQLEFEEEN